MNTVTEKFVMLKAEFKKYHSDLNFNYNMFHRNTISVFKLYLYFWISINFYLRQFTFKYYIAEIFCKNTSKVRFVFPYVCWEISFVLHLKLFFVLYFQNNAYSFSKKQEYHNAIFLLTVNIILNLSIVKISFRIFILEKCKLFIKIYCH